MDQFLDLTIPEPNSGCWLWVGGRRGRGYGGFYWYEDGKRCTDKAHRVSWRLHKGAIPEGKFVLHHCDNKMCVNPDHLYLGVHQDNIRDAVNRGQWKPHFGKANGMSRLNERAIRDIRSGRLSNSQFAEWYGVNRMTVWQIATGKTWRHVK